MQIGFKEVPLARLVTTPNERYHGCSDKCVGAATRIFGLFDTIKKPYVVVNTFDPTVPLCSGSYNSYNDLLRGPLVGMLRGCGIGDKLTVTVQAAPALSITEAPTRLVYASPQTS